MRDDDEEDDYVLFGTPLPDLDDDAIVKKKAAQDLTVRDEKGRQRFHGAFTGGFSAGYFNTVGTKEGWEPKTFSSSRAIKASSSFHQNPEDFMDEEDFGEFGIAPKKIHTTSNFRDPSTSFARKRTHVEGDEIIPGVPPLKDIIKPVTESVGIRILKQMGWRHGQGIGPRVKKKTDSGIKGCSLGRLASEDDNDPVISEVTFAPDDSAEVPYTPKDDYHGIGYSGLSTQSVLSLPVDDAFSLSKTKSWLAKDKRKLNIRGQAFGVGAFEDDDDDIYSKDDMSQYDFSELMGDKNDHQKEKSKKDSRDKYSSVIEVLEGFTLASKPATARKHFAAPDLPKNFCPMNKKSFLSSEHLPQSDTSKHTLNPNVRSILIGEKLFEKAENKMQKPSLQPRRSRFDVGPSEMQTSSSGAVGSRLGQGTSIVPSHSPSLLGSSKFKPFDKDSDKQKRYEEFVKIGCNKDQLESLQPLSMTEWERQQELDEFMKAAILYQPLCKALDSRFESKSHLGVEFSLIVPKKVEPADTPAKKPVDDKPYRETFEWHPVALLCKRFNVPNPYPDSQYQGTPMTEKKKKPSLFGNLFLESDLPHKSVPSTSAIEPNSSKSCEPKKTTEKEENALAQPSRKDHENTVLETPAVQEIPKGSRPSIDLFKEIFQNSSSEDPSSEEDTAKNIDSDKTSIQSSIENGNIEKTEPKSTLQTSESKTTGSESKAVATEKKGFGVFANLDLDALSKRTPSTHKLFNKEIEDNKPSKSTTPSEIMEERTTEKPPVSEASAADDPEDVYYGPAPPPPGTVAVITNYEVSPHKHSKHKHKQHKHKVKKKKKKEKKKHSRKDSEKSSGESEEDIPSSLILEKLRQLKELDRISKK